MNPNNQQNQKIDPSQQNNPQMPVEPVAQPFIQPQSQVQPQLDPSIEIPAQSPLQQQQPNTQPIQPIINNTQSVQNLQPIIPEVPQGQVYQQPQFQPQTPTLATDYISNPFKLLLPSLKVLKNTGFIFWLLLIGISVFAYTIPYSGVFLGIIAVIIGVILALTWAISSLSILTYKFADVAKNLTKTSNRFAITEGVKRTPHVLLYLLMIIVLSFIFLIPTYLMLISPIIGIILLLVIQIGVLWILPALCMSLYVLVYEKIGLGSAINKGRDLTRGHWVEIIGALSLFLMVQTLLSAALLPIILSSKSVTSLLIIYLVSLVISSILYLLSYSVLAVQYTQLNNLIKNGQQKPKTSVINIVIILLTVVVVIAYLWFAYSRSPQLPTTDKSTTPSSQSDLIGNSPRSINYNSDENVVSKKLKIGETADFGVYSITVKSVETLGKITKYDALGEGKLRVIYFVSINNNSKKELDTFTLFSCSSKSGEIDYGSKANLTGLPKYDDAIPGSIASGSGADGYYFCKINSNEPIGSLLFENKVLTDSANYIYTTNKAEFTQ